MLVICTVSTGFVFALFTKFTIWIKTLLSRT